MINGVVLTEDRQFPVLVAHPEIILKRRCVHLGSAHSIASRFLEGDFWPGSCVVGASAFGKHWAIESRVPHADTSTAIRLGA